MKPSRVVCGVRVCGLCLRMAGAVLLGGAPGCTKKATAIAPAAPVDVPKRWSELRLPADGLTKVLAGTDAHGYYADYAGSDRDGLWQKVTAALGAAGYAPACTAFDDTVRGFAKGGDKLAAKIDSLGGLSLSLFDAQGHEPLLHGVCFGRFTAGPPKAINPSDLDK